MDKPESNYRIHDPNTAETLIPYILNVFIEANKGFAAEVYRRAASDFDVDTSHPKDLQADSSKRSGGAGPI